MYNAPSVAYPVGRCAFLRLLYATLFIGTTVVLIYWFMCQGLNGAWCVATMATVLGLVGGVFAWRQTAMLSWHDGVWCLQRQSDGLPDSLGQVQVMLDLQKTLLLRWQPTSDTLRSPSLWLWLGAERSSAHWHDLRCAVYQRQELKEEKWLTHWQ